MRVQIPAYTDRWMMGDRFGDLLKVTRGKRNTGTIGVRASILTSSADRYGQAIDVAHVKLDKSGKTVKVLLDDCEVI